MVTTAEVREDGAAGGTPPEATPPAGTHGLSAHTGDQTRARIMEVALELIADHGYAATSTREISERLGFTKAALYYHFRTKDDLLAALVAPSLGGLTTLIERGRERSSAAGRRELVQGYVDLVGAHADLIHLLSNDPSVKESAALKAALPLFEELVRLLTGTADPDTAQRTRGRAAIGAVHAALLHARPGDDPGVVRKTAVEAACGALGLNVPARRTRRPA